MSVLACDLGGTRMKIGVVRGGQVLAQTILPANAQIGLAYSLKKLKAAWLRLLAKLKLEVSDCDGISIAFPSLVNPTSGRVLAEYGKYADAMQIDLCAWGQHEFGLPLAIENDARMALVGEWLAGAGCGLDNLVMITLGTGLGTSAIIEGQLLCGKHGQAGVLGGHFTVNCGGRECSCGNLGCAEAEASTAFLPKLLRTRPDFKTSRLAKAAVLDYASVFQLAALGDVCAQKVRDNSMRVWSSLAVNLIHAYDPEVVIIGGGIMASAEVILPFVQSYVSEHAHTPWGKVEVVASKLGDQAVFAAAEWLLEKQSRCSLEQCFAKERAMCEGKTCQWSHE
jgi:glucokinase